MVSRKMREMVLFSFSSTKRKVYSLKGGGGLGLQILLSCLLDPEPWFRVKGSGSGVPFSAWHKNIPCAKSVGPCRRGPASKE